MNQVYSKNDKKEVFDLRKKGLTYAKISRKTGISIQTVGQWVRDNRKPLKRKQKKN